MEAVHISMNLNESLQCTNFFPKRSTIKDPEFESISATCWVCAFGEAM